MAIAHALGKFEHEVLELSTDEITDWMAFFKIKADTEKAAMKKAKSKAKRASRR